MLALLTVVWLAWAIPGQPITHSQLGPSPARVVLAMRYHGVNFVTHHPDGTVTFERAGKTCKLFTNGCVQYLNKARKEQLNAN